MKVQLCYAVSSDYIWKNSCFLEEGACVDDLLKEAGFYEAFPDLSLESLGIGLFSRKITLDTVLHEGDRVELYRGLIFDPKESRRRRAEVRKEGILKPSHLNRRAPEIEENREVY